MRWLPRAPWDIAKRVLLWLAAGVTMLSGYALTKLEPYGPPQLLPLTAWDRAIPFLPETIWLYGTASYAALIAFVQAPDRVASRRLFFAVALAAATCWVCFALFPTTYPRELYPLPDEDTLTVREFASLRAADSPANCLPSQHVALAWSLGLTWAGFLRRSWARALPVVWAIGVSVTTLTTKQHYIVDVAAGFAVGVAAFAIVRRGVTPDTPPFWARWDRPLALARDADRRAIAALRERVEAHQWRLDDVPWPDRAPPLDAELVRLVNEVVYIEEIAALNFRVLRDAAADPDLRALYDRFHDEERRHAEGLRRLLRAHGAPLLPPGLGNALVLDQFDTIDPRADATAVLVATSNPVFETFLDAGTIPFLREHPALRGPAFDAFVERVCADEAAHLAVNWIVTREMARRYAGLRGLRLLLDPNVGRGAAAVPWMSLGVYSRAWRCGFRFERLLPAFARLWRLHEQKPELAAFPLWWSFRLFVVAGVIATWTCIGLDRVGLLWGRLWTTVAGAADRVGWWLFGPRLLERRGLPAPSAAP